MRARSQRIIGSARPRCFGSMEQEQDFPWKEKHRAKSGYGRRKRKRMRMRMRMRMRTRTRKEGRKEANPSVYVAMKPPHSRAIRDFRPSVHRNLRIGSFTLRGNDRRNSLKKKEEKFNVKHCHFLFFFMCAEYTIK